MNNKQVLVYGVLESTNDFRSVFVGHIHFCGTHPLISTTLRNKNMGQSLFKKHSTFKKFDEIFYCWMTRFRNVKLGVFRQYQNTKAILKKKNTRQNRFKKRSKFRKFQLSNFTLTWSNEGKVNSVRPGMTYSRSPSQKGIIKHRTIFQFNRSRVIKFLLYNIHSEQSKTDKN